MHSNTSKDKRLNIELSTITKQQQFLLYKAKYKFKKSFKTPFIRLNMHIYLCNLDHNILYTQSRLYHEKYSIYIRKGMTLTNILHPVCHLKTFPI